MEKREQMEQYGFFYDDDGTNQVTAQIMDSYSSGVIGEEKQNKVDYEAQTK